MRWYRDKENSSLSSNPPAALLHKAARINFVVNSADYLAQIFIVLFLTAIHHPFLRHKIAQSTKFLGYLCIE